MELDSADEDRSMALDNIRINKAKVAKTYNKNVKHKSFIEGDLIWKTIFPLGNKDPKYGKWLPNWEGHYVVSKPYPGGAYKLISMQGEELNRNINGKYLKSTILLYRKKLYWIIVK